MPGCQNNESRLSAGRRAICAMTEGQVVFYYGNEFIITS